LRKLLMKRRRKLMMKSNCDNPHCFDDTCQGNCK